MTDNNGQSQPQPQPLQMPPQAKVVDECVRIVIQTVIAGIIGNTRGAPPQVVLPLIAWNVGNRLGDVLAGDLQSLLKARVALKEAFDDGVQKSTLHQSHAPPGPPLPKLPG